MNANTARAGASLGNASLLWNIEISDLGGCKPFLGYALTDQYILVGVTAPDAQNEVAITSIPDTDEWEIVIPLTLNKFEFPVVGGLKFGGDFTLYRKWHIRLRDRSTGLEHVLNPTSLFEINEKKERFRVHSVGMFTSFNEQETPPRFEIIVRPTA